MKEQLNSFKPYVAKLNEKVNEINKVGDERERLKKEQLEEENMTTDTKASMLFINCIVHTCIVHIQPTAVEIHKLLEQTNRIIGEFTKSTDSQVFYL